MNSNWRRKMSRGSLSKPTMNPPITSMPACCTVFTASDRSRLRFCSLLHSSSPSCDGVSMPMNTFLNPARAMSSHSSVSSARFMDASVRNPIVGAARAPLDHLPEQLLGALAIPDEVIVNDEYHVAPALSPQGIQLAHDLRRILGARHSAVHHHDIAEFAVEGASARELHRHGDVVAQAQQVPAWRRHRAHVRPGLRTVHCPQAP